AFSSIRNSNAHVDVAYNINVNLPSSLSSYLPNVEMAGSLLTPASPYKLFPTNIDDDTNVQESQPSPRLLSRHRLSLPAQPMCTNLSVRSVTPEIKVTGVTSDALTKLDEVEKCVLGIPLLSKRMSKSTEEIVSECVAGGQRNLNTEDQKQNFSKESRSNSTQNIFSSALSM